MGKHDRNSNQPHQETEPQDILAEETPRRGMVKSVISILLIIGVLASWWYGFGNSYAKVRSAMISAKSGIASVLHLSRSTDSLVVADEGLSTGFSDSASSNEEMNSGSVWQIRKSAVGDTIWKVYAESIQTNKDVVFQTQVINGLKNITLIKNQITRERAITNSLSLNKEYSFVGQDIQLKFAGKVAEANKKLQEGTHLKDMDGSLRLAYQLANAPSYSFVYSVSVGDVQNLLE